MSAIYFHFHRSAAGRACSCIFHYAFLRFALLKTQRCLALNLLTATSLFHTLLRTQFAPALLQFYSCETIFLILCCCYLHFFHFTASKLNISLVHRRLCSQPPSLISLTECYALSQATNFGACRRYKQHFIVHTHTHIYVHLRSPVFRLLHIRVFLLI